MNSITISAYTHGKHVRSVRLISNFDTNESTCSNRSTNVSSANHNESTCSTVDNDQADLGSASPTNHKDPTICTDLVNHDLNSISHSLTTSPNASVESTTLNECNEPCASHRRTVRLVYKHEVDHYSLFLLLVTLNGSSVFRQKFANQFSDLGCTQLVVKYNLNDTPIYPLLKAW